MGGTVDMWRSGRRYGALRRCTQPSFVAGELSAGVDDA
jgi:hypothetical protein